MASPICPRCRAYYSWNFTTDRCDRCGLYKVEEYRRQVMNQHRRPGLYQNFEYVTPQQVAETQALQAFPSKLKPKPLSSLPGAVGPVVPKPKSEPTPLEWLSQEVKRYTGAAFT